MHVNTNIPRVTEILRPFNGYDQIPKAILENAAARGTTVHSLCAGIAKGNWIPDSMIQTEHLGYVNSFRLWSKAQVRRFLITERRYTEIGQTYSGQLDYVIEGSDGEIYLVDLKTSAQPKKSHQVQMAAYVHLLQQNNIPVSGAMLVYLSKEGEFPDIAFFDDLQDAFRIFACALECHQYFKSGKIKHDTRNPIEECISKSSSDHGGIDVHPER